MPSEKFLKSEKNLIFCIIINLLITITEIVGGVLSGSLALLSDSFHNLSDTVSLFITYTAFLISKKEKDTKKTYGYKRAEIIAALINVLFLLLICIYIIYEAIKRIQNPQNINFFLMLLVALFGFIGNGISIILLHKDIRENMNIKSAFLHLLTDTFSSLGVIIAAIVLIFKPIYILDSILSILIVIFIIKESFEILIKSINILMQSTPLNIDTEKIINRLLNEKKLNIKNIHHIHIWEFTPFNIIFDAHIIVKKEELVNSDRIIYEINKILLCEYGITHTTLQIESEDFNHNTECEI